MRKTFLFFNEPETLIIINKKKNMLKEPDVFFSLLGLRLELGVGLALISCIDNHILIAVSG